MQKLSNYINYIIEFIRYGDIVSLYNSFSFVTFKHANSTDRIIRGRTGWFYCRKNTDDFKHASFAKDLGTKAFLLKHIRNYDVFIDVGSGIGEWSILLANKQVKCHAFEPVTINYHSLLKNIKLNSLHNSIKAYPFGLGDEMREASFVFFPVKTGSSRLARDPAEANCTVELRDLDSLIQNMDISPADYVLMRLGAKGMDTEIIRGAKEFIASSSSLMLIFRKQYKDTAEVRKTLDEIGHFEYGMVDQFNLYAAKMN
jgi:FkbM family methyltransferase